MARTGYSNYFYEGCNLYGNEFAIGTETVNLIDDQVIAGAKTFTDPGTFRKLVIENGKTGAEHQECYFQYNAGNGYLQLFDTNNAAVLSFITGQTRFYNVLYTDKGFYANDTAQFAKAVSMNQTLSVAGDVTMTKNCQHQGQTSFDGEAFFFNTVSFRKESYYSTTEYGDTASLAGFIDGDKSGLRFSSMAAQYQATTPEETHVKDFILYVNHMDNTAGLMLESKLTTFFMPTTTFNGDIWGTTLHLGGTTFKLDGDSSTIGFYDGNFNFYGNVALNHNLNVVGSSTFGQGATFGGNVTIAGELNTAAGATTKLGNIITANADMQSVNIHGPCRMDQYISFGNSGAIDMVNTNAVPEEFHVNVDVGGVRVRIVRQGFYMAATDPEPEEVLTVTENDARYVRYQAIDKAAFDALTTKDALTMYMVTDSTTNQKQLFMGPDLLLGSVPA